MSAVQVNYYNVLGVARQANAEDIKRAYRKKAMQSHPDVDRAPGASERFIQINEAYEILSDPRKRAVYDLRLSTGTVSEQATRAKQREEAYRQWVRDAQVQGQRHAAMNYTQFKRTRFDRTEAKVYVYLQFLVMGALLALGTLILTAPFMAMYYIDWKGVFLAVLFVPLAFRIYELGVKGLREVLSYF